MFYISSLVCFLVALFAKDFARSAVYLVVSSLFAIAASIEDISIVIKNKQEK